MEELLAQFRCEKCERPRAALRCERDRDWGTIEIKNSDVPSGIALQASVLGTRKKRDARCSDTGYGMQDLGRPSAPLLNHGKARIDTDGLCEKLLSSVYVRVIRGFF